LSRVGRKPIKIPDGVQVEVVDNLVKVSGQKGELTQEIHPSITVVVEDGHIYVHRPSDSKLHKSLHGLYRALIANMVKGVSEGFEKRLEIIGIGYKAEKKGRSLLLQLGYSHPIVFRPPEGIELNVPAPNVISVSGASKELVGNVAAKIRSLRPPEPYKGKGIRYVDEWVRRKAGKSAGK